MGYTLNKDTKTLKPKGFKKMNFPKTHQKNAGVVILTSSNINSNIRSSIGDEETYSMRQRSVCQV